MPNGNATPLINLELRTAFPHNDGIVHIDRANTLDQKGSERHLMFKLLRLIRFLNPFKVFALVKGVRLMRHKFKGLAALLCAASALQIVVMPDWLRSLIDSVGNRQQPQAVAGANPGNAEGGFLDGVLAYFSGSETSPETETLRPAATDNEGGFFSGLLEYLGKSDAPTESVPGQPQVPATPDQGSGGFFDDLLGYVGMGGKSEPPSQPAASRDDGRPGFQPPSANPGPPPLFAAFAHPNIAPDQLQRIPDSPHPPTAPPADVSWHTITGIVDGDSLLVDGHTVCLIGVAAPEAYESDYLHAELDKIGARGKASEMLALGRKSSEFLARFQGRRCWLEFEGTPRDRYGRVLAYVHLDDGVNLNELVLYQGYAKVFLGGNFRYLKRYVQLQDEAMRRRNGLWAWE